MTKHYRTSLILRALSGILLVVAVLACGYAHRSSWNILTLGLVFTALHAVMKWTAWRLAWEQGGSGKIIRAIVLTYPTQLLIIGLLYLIGLGIGTLLNTATTSAHYESLDSLFALSLLLIVGVMGMVANKLNEPLAFDYTDSDLESGAPATFDILDLDPEPITIETFFLTHPEHYEDPDPEEPAFAPQATIQLIEETEKRLGVKLPGLLRSLYQTQNGGYVGWLFAPMRSNPRFNTDDWRGVFSIDFCELRPLEYLLTLDDALQDYSEELGDRVPKNASRMVVLSQRYLDVTCLDYSQTGEPKVFIADFDIYSSKQELRVDDFATFFESLKRLQS